MKYHKIILIFTICGFNILFSTQTNSQTTESYINDSVIIVGEMKNVMWKGELFGVINIDTISNKNHLYGLGPVEYLTGEIMLIDGKGYKAVVVDDTTMEVTETFSVKAPFFAYANILSWKEIPMNDSISTIPQLENYLNGLTKKDQRPFFFRINATVDNAVVHVANLPAGTTVASPEDAHLGQKNYEIINKEVELVGFFSTKHKSIFTHHDTYVHIHLITHDKQQMGHLETLNLKKGTATIYIQDIF